MEFRFSPQAAKNYGALARALQRATEKQLQYLICDLRHPSLHAKKYNETSGLWLGRINKSWRFYFLIAHDVYVIVSLRKHPK